MRAIRRLALLTACAAVTLALGACGSAPASQAPPVPEIDNPKDVRGANPCDLLTPQQLDRFGLGPGTPGRNDLGPQCVWRGAGSKKVTLTLFTSGEGLSALARNSDPAASRVRLQGYPALETFTADGKYCQYDVGIAPDQALIVTMTGGKPNSCAALQDIVPAVLDNLPPYRS